MKKLICVTLLIEKSPQALPLGAACIASAVKNDSRTKNLYDARLIDYCRESPEIEKIYSETGPGQIKNAGELAVGTWIAKELAALKPDIVCFSIYVWNHIALEKAALEIKKLIPGVITVAGGPRCIFHSRRSGSYCKSLRLFRNGLFHGRSRRRCHN